MTIYVRNWRPNPVMFKHAGVKILLQKRGSRDDNVALPDEALSNGVVERFLRQGRLERITEEGFFNLASRSEDEVMPPISRKKLERLEISGKPEKGSPLTSKPFVVEELDNRVVRSPSLEWEYPPEPTQPPFVEIEETKVDYTHDPFGLLDKEEEAEPEAVKAPVKKKSTAK